MIMSLLNVRRVAAQPELSLCKVDSACLDRRPKQLSDSGVQQQFHQCLSRRSRFPLPWLIVIQGTSMFSGFFSISFAIS